ncbi:Cytochrome c biogenesis protein CcmG [Raoultella terrigena]|uniref:Cytochrome c biogenesis protein CcmG n=1 Tax=Raoultella terrigena TaxID=577 RepID=A0A4U9CXV8_RAOTE|nr:Cytochrome c biogenesis protein CcmG [Raoultella terrigena]
MNRRWLFLPLALFLALAAALFWQLMRNADGDDPTTLESALVGKPVPEFRLESAERSGPALRIARCWSAASRCCSTSGRPGARPVAPSISSLTAWHSRGYA